VLLHLQVGGGRGVLKVGKGKVYIFGVGIRVYWWPVRVIEILFMVKLNEVRRLSLGKPPEVDKSPRTSCRPPHCRLDFPNFSFVSPQIQVENTTTGRY
jgi:hypothetical protein